MTGIWEYPDEDEIEDWFNNTIRQLADQFIETTGIDRQVFQRIDTLEILIGGKFGRGTGDIGDDPLHPIFIINIEGEQTSESEIFDEVVVPLLETLENDDVWDGLMVDPPTPTMLDWFTGIEMFRSIFANDRSEEAISFHLQREQPNIIYSLTTRELITTEEIIEEDLSQRELQVRLSLEEFDAVQAGEAEPSDFLEGRTEIVRHDPEEFFGEEEIEEPEIPEEPTPEPPTERFPKKDEFLEDMPPVLTSFAESEDTLEVPSGKETRQVEPREIYPFEVAMGHEDPEMPRDHPELHNFQEGVGFDIAMGRLGDTVPASNVPKTGLYIKNRLLHEGPAYILQMYRDMVVYSAYISGLHQMSFKTGSYESFRVMVGRLYHYGDGGELIDRVSPSTAVEAGLDITPNHPTIEGEKAPWLEDRQYYRIIEENADSPVWEDITEALYS